MTLSHHSGFASIGAVVARELLPRLRHARKLPLRISCIATTGYDGFERTTVIGRRAAAEQAMILACHRVARDDIRINSYDALRFRPRIMVIQDSDLGLVLGGEIRADIVLWQHPVVSDAEARRVVLEASRLRGRAFTSAGRGDGAVARDLRIRASLLEARLVDPYWREIAAELLRLPQAA